MNLKKILLYVWQLPQNLLGQLLFRWYGRDRLAVESAYRGVRVLYSRKMNGGISLGSHIVLPYIHSLPHVDNSPAGMTLRHEWGHTRQSLILGWLYLPFVGFQSMAHAILHRKACGDGSDYHHFWTERWADRLGGVERD